MMVEFDRSSHFYYVKNFKTLIWTIRFPVKIMHLKPIPHSSPCLRNPPIHKIFDLFYLWPLYIIIKFQSKTFFLFLLTIYPHGIILHNIGCSVSPTPCGLLPLPSDDPYLELIDFSLLLLGNPLEQIPNI